MALVVFLVLGFLGWLLIVEPWWGDTCMPWEVTKPAAQFQRHPHRPAPLVRLLPGCGHRCHRGNLYTAKVGAANPSTLAVGYELNAIAAAVVGGCSACRAVWA